MYYNTCPFCGSNNDPGETCECEKSYQGLRPSKETETASDNKNTLKSKTKISGKNARHSKYDQAS